MRNQVRGLIDREAHYHVCLRLKEIWIINGEIALGDRTA